MKREDRRIQPQMTQMGADGEVDLRASVQSPIDVRSSNGGNKDEHPLRELSGQIIGAAMKVLNELKPGLDERLYENALVLELIAQGHRVEQQSRFPGAGLRWG